ncbi:DUF2797 domain-containing protein [Candidatus Micrarchaeota archaeon]|nr:DUF2797 domain-containing protein [Candidatus Micrarchaeota archaeon]
MQNLHLISYLSSESPSIYYWSEDQSEKLELNSQINLNFSAERFCIGYYNGQNRFRCPNNSINCLQCPTCKYSDISKVYTRLNFTGFEHLAEKLSSEYYSIYLAYFGGSSVKVGVTQTKRIEKRLREQGADLWTRLMDFDNANNAYTMEKLLQETFGLKNSVTSKYKIQNLGKIDNKIIEKTIQEIKTSDPFNDYLVENPFVNKINYKIPNNFSIVENIDGEFLESKGNFLFYRKDDSVFVVNMKEKEGRLFSSGTL